jgi:hypothetical protein
MPLPEQDIEFRPGGRAPLAGTMDEVSSQGTWFRFAGRCSDCSTSSF